MRRFAASKEFQTPAKHRPLLEPPLSPIRRPNPHNSCFRFLGPITYRPQDRHNPDSACPNFFPNLPSLLEAPMVTRSRLALAAILLAFSAGRVRSQETTTAVVAEPSGFAS